MSSIQHFSAETSSLQRDGCSAQGSTQLRMPPIDTNSSNSRTGTMDAQRQILSQNFPFIPEIPLKEMLSQHVPKVSDDLFAYVKTELRNTSAILEERMFGYTKKTPSQLDASEACVFRALDLYFAQVIQICSRYQAKSNMEQCDFTYAATQAGILGAVKNSSKADGYFFHSIIRARKRCHWDEVLAALEKKPQTRETSDQDVRLFH